MAAAISTPTIPFQHTAARRRLGKDGKDAQDLCGFNTQPPEGGWVVARLRLLEHEVSTHSRPKAAGRDEIRA